MKTPTFEYFRKTVSDVCKNTGIHPYIRDISLGCYPSFMAEFSTPKGDADPMAGMTVAWHGHPEDMYFEVFEIMAGPKQDQLWVYMETKSLRCAVKNALKGNNRSKKLKIW